MVESLGVARLVAELACKVWVCVLILCVAVSPGLAQVSGWNATGGGDWMSEQNWNAGVPNAIGAQAVFGPSFPTGNATVRVNAPITVGSFTSGNQHAITLRDNPITFDNGGLGAALYVDSGAGQLSVYPNLTLSDNLQFLVDKSAGPLLINGRVSGPGNIGVALGGTVQINGDNADWSGALSINGGRVSVKHANGLGTTDVGTVVNAGSLQLNAATGEPIEVRGGVLTVNNTVQHVTLNGGAVRMKVDRPVTFLEADSQGGEVQLDVQRFTSPIVLPANSAGTPPSTLLGVGDGSTPYQSRVVAGSVAMAGPAADNWLRLGSRDEVLNVEVPLLRANNIGAVEITEGYVELAGGGDFTGQTIVAAGARLTANNATSLGTSSDSESDATIVRTGGIASVSSEVSESELIILEGGRYYGAGTRNVIVRDRGVIATWGNTGTITGTGELGLVAGDLRVPLDFAGDVLIVSGGNEMLEVNHPQGLGSTGRPVVVAGGELYLRTPIVNPLHIDAGQVRVNTPSIESEILLRGGSLVSGGYLGHDNPTVEVNAPIAYTGDGSAIGALNLSQLILNDSVAGDGDLKVGPRVIVNGPLEVGGDLRPFGLSNEFHTAPTVGGRLVLSDVPGISTSATFYTDVTLPVLLRGGELRTADGATFYNPTPVMEVRNGAINARLGGVDTILKSGGGRLYLDDIGPTDADIVIREGTVEAARAGAFGSDVGRVIVDAARGAALTLLDSGQTYTEPIELRNATGIDWQGGLVLDTGTGGSQYAGVLDLGDRGAVVGVRSGFTLSGEVRGGDLTLVGEGRLRIADARLNYTGRTVIDHPTLSLSSTGRLPPTTAIEIRRGVLELDKRDQTVVIDQLSDNVFIDMQRGTLRLLTNAWTVDARESIGIVSLSAGTSEIIIENSNATQVPSTLALDQLVREPGTVMRFDSVPYRLGGSDVLDPHVTISQPPALTNGILGPWALVHEGDHPGRYDFAELQHGRDSGPRDSWPASGVERSTTCRPCSAHGHADATRE